MTVTHTNNWNQCDTVCDTAFALYDDPDFRWESEQAQHAYEQHLSGCPECRQYQMQIKNSIQALKQLATVPAGAEADVLTDKIVAFVESHQDEPVAEQPAQVVPIRKNWQVWSSVAAAVVLMVVAFPLVSNYMPSSKPAASVQMAAGSDTQDIANDTIATLTGAELSPFQDTASTSTGNDDPIAILVGF